MATNGKRLGDLLLHADVVTKRQLQKAIDIKEDGSLCLETEGTRNLPMKVEELSAQVSIILKTNPSLQVIVRGDGEVKYKRVMELMAALQMSGAEDVGLITKPPKKD